MGLNEKFFKSAAGGITASDNFAPVLYTGNGSIRSITGVGFEPDLVWIKKRSSASTGDHMLFDSVRGVDKVIISNSTQAEYNGGGSGYQTSFDSDGFSITSNAFVNQSSATYVAWNWKAGGAASSNTDGTITSQVSANTDAGFSIVSWTGLGNNGQTVGHGLGAAPELIITKVLNIAGEGWYTYSAETGNTKFLTLNTTAEAKTAQQAGYSAGSNWWNDTSPTSSVFSLGNIAEIKSYNHIAYCFHSVDGYSKIGSYNGGSTGSGNVISTGFKPRYVILKTTSSGEDWHCFDSVRGGGDTFVNDLRPNTSEVESTFSPRQINFVNDGFYWTNAENGVNGSGKTYIYLAIA